MKPVFAVVLLLLSTTVAAQNSIYRVGSDPDCTHTTIQAAVNAAAANPLPDGHTREIRVTSGTHTLTESVTVSGQSNDIQMIGNYAGCATSSPSSGYDNTIIEITTAGERVFTITGSSAGFKLSLRLLTVRGQQNGPTQGGLALVSGNATLELQDGARLEQGQADQGGAVYLAGGLFGATARLRMAPFNPGSSRPEIINNSARRGGGVLCGPSAAIELEFAGFRNNFASEDGGAIYAAPCPGGITVEPFNRTSLASHIIVFSSNSAGNQTTGSFTNRGGAIYMDGNKLLSTHEEIQTHPNFPIWFWRNRADLGGAIYASGSSLPTTIDMDTPAFLNNTARQRGGALYLRGRVQAHLHSSQPNRCWVSEGVYSDPSCHYYRGNTAQGSGVDSLVHGGVFYLDNGGSPAGWNPSITIERAWINGNDGGSALIGYASMGSTMTVHASTIAGNGGSSNAWLFVAQTDQTFQFRHNTVATNAGEGTIFAAGPLETHIHGSIIWNPGTRVWLPFDADASIHWGGCALVNTLDFFPPQPGLPLTSDPMLNPPRYTLSAGSPAIDRCTTNHLNWIDDGDLDQHLMPRNQVVTDGAGTPVDIGARELYDGIFADRFNSQ